MTHEIREQVVDGSVYFSAIALLAWIARSVGRWVIARVAADAERLLAAEAENDALRDEIAELKADVARLEAEVGYLRSRLAE